MTTRGLNIGCGMWGTTVVPWPAEAPPNLDFGGPLLPPWVNVDYHEPPNLSPKHEFVRWDLNLRPWPFPDGTFTDVRAYHILEHLDDVGAAMQEIHRVCLPDALVDIVVPYAGTVGDAANPQHRHQFNHRTFEYFCRGLAATNDLDLGARGFTMVRQWLRERGQETFEGIVWQNANLQVHLRVVK